MNEMTSVAMNGSCVTTMRKTRAGSSGARRAQSPVCRRAPPGRVDRRVSRRLLTPVSTAMLMTPSPGGSFGLPGAVALGDVLRELLPAFQRVVDAHLARDRGTDVLGDLGAQVGELGDVDELDADGGPRLDARVRGVGALDGGAGRLGEGRRLLDVLGVLVRGRPLARRHPGPAELPADQLLVLLAGGPGHELPGVVLLLARLLDAPGPRVEPPGAVGLHDGGGRVAHLPAHR